MTMKTSTTLPTVNGLLSIKGPDTVKFLQGQLTCDMDKLTNTNALPGAYCTPQGRVRATFIIIKIAEDDFLLIMPKIQVAFLIEAMAPYVAFFKCAMSDSSADWQLSGEQTEQTANNRWAVITVNDSYKIKLPGEPQRWLLLTRQSNEELTDSSLLESSQWQQQDLLSGLIWIDETSRDNFLPHDLSLPALGAVSFTKGCYTGQEIIARMEYRGEPKYLLAVLTTEPSDDEIPEKLLQKSDSSESIKMGTVIEKMHLNDKSWLILASVKRSFINQQQFQLLSNKRDILCHISIPDTIKESNNP